MAANGRRCGILLNRLGSCVQQALGTRAQQLGSSSTSSTSSQIGCVPAASIHGTAVAFQSAGPIEGKTEWEGAGGPPSGVGWREINTRGKSGRGFVRQISTHKPAEATAPKEGEFYEEVPKEETKIDNEEAKVAEEKVEEEEEEVDEKTQTLRAALAHVPNLGWSEAAMAAGARDVGLSPAIAGAFPRKEAALVEFFMDEATLALSEELESREEELGKLGLQDRVAAIVWTRLEMQIPYLSKWAQALSIQAYPTNLPTTLKQRALLADEIWHSAGDRSADMDWYAKRAILSGVYSTTELFMLTDISPGFKDTRAFLERRINDALDCRNTVQEAGHLAQAVRAGLQNTVSSFLNRSKPPSGFGF